MNSISMEQSQHQGTQLGQSKPCTHRRACKCIRRRLSRGGDAQVCGARPQCLRGLCTPSLASPKGEISHHGKLPQLHSPLRCMQPSSLSARSGKVFAAEFPALRRGPMCSLPSPHATACGVQERKSVPAAGRRHKGGTLRDNSYERAAA